MNEKETDLIDIQFKLHNGFNSFETHCEIPPTVGVHFLATASNFGLIFAGNPYAPKLNIFKHKDIIDAKYDNLALRTRVVELPAPVTYLSCNADGSLLAISYNINGCPYLQIYFTQSFFMPKVTTFCATCLSTEENINVTELLWNPVLRNYLAVILDNGVLGMCVLTDSGQLNSKTLDKSVEIQCGSWSPKGKQIVLACANGMLQQYTPDLTPARLVNIPAEVLNGPFDCLSICWLSTYQFAVVLLQRGENSCPHIVIVNAFKADNITYKDYYDVCYSSDGPRKHRFMLTHLISWNFLLVLSANGLEVGILGSENNDKIPKWIPYICDDQARIAFPLNKDKSDQFSIGLSVDTASTHRLMINESELNPMPMIHVLTTHGLLQSFNFLNLFPNAVRLCSPPVQHTDMSEMFSLIEVEDYCNQSVKEEKGTNFSPEKSGTTEFSLSFANTSQMSLYETFSFNNTETSSKASPIPELVTFNNRNNQLFSNVESLSGPSSIQNKNLVITSPDTSVNNRKALFATSPTVTNEHLRQRTDDKTKLFQDYELMSGHVFYLDILDFDRTLQTLLVKQRNNTVVLGHPEEYRNNTLTLLELEKTFDQAGPKDFQRDIHHLRHEMVNLYAMLEHIKTNMTLSKNSHLKNKLSLPGFDKYNGRSLMKSYELIRNNKFLLKTVELELEMQRVIHYDILRKIMPFAPRLDPIGRSNFRCLGITQNKTRFTKRISLIKPQEIVEQKVITPEILAKHIFSEEVKFSPSNHTLHINPKHKRIALCLALKRKVTAAKKIFPKRLSRLDIDSLPILEANISQMSISDDTSTNHDITQINIVKPIQANSIELQNVFGSLDQASPSTFNVNETN
ncbi:nuclear pore complex protein Nup214-like [Teleopsis dalmanni]|uniref:nuclear pore complex protein Nup214-like n=1 Tax=Teleopsis dalmanni TaxID=139649 RepID=UPI0018CC94DB|nr:nuclear pore complex protein Nup214-like [Teleopsis dalmanni]